jgi:hypothetical protein
MSNLTPGSRIADVKTFSPNQKVCEMVQMDDVHQFPDRRRSNLIYRVLNSLVGCDWDPQSVNELSTR